MSEMQPDQASALQADVDDVRAGRTELTEASEPADQAEQQAPVDHSEALEAPPSPLEDPQPLETNLAAIVANISSLGDPELASEISDLYWKDYAVRLRVTSSTVQLIAASGQTLPSTLHGHRHKILAHGLPNDASRTISISAKEELFGVEAVHLLQSSGQHPLALDLFAVHRHGKKQDAIVVAYRLTCDSPLVRQRALDAITQLLNEQQRPRRLAVIINPFSGKKQAREIYNRTSSLFRMSNVTVDISLTMRPNHATDIASQYQLSLYDGIVIFGGDGTLNEVLAGLYSRPDRASVPIAIIPSGSTDTVACTVNGTRDAVTAVINVLMGHERLLDIGSIFSPTSNIHSFFSNMVTFGFFGDVIQSSEKMRYLGPARYDVAGAVTYFRHRAFRMRVEFIRAPRFTAGQRCNDRCPSCQHLAAAAVEPATGPWETLEDEFQSVSLASISLVNEKSSNGYVPDAHLSDGVAHLVLVRKCSRIDYLRFLVSIAHSGTHLSLPFVERIPVVAVNFRPISGTHAEPRHWAIDGQEFYDQEINVRMDRQPLRVFARGPVAT
eukprot:m.398570 g.398570  ORF g.398570 m.398570 type:complete len:554 (+) comp56428_c0_seq13:2101-3762(+)